MLSYFLITILNLYAYIPDLDEIDLRSILGYRKFKRLDLYFVILYAVISWSSSLYMIQVKYFFPQLLFPNKNFVLFSIICFSYKQYCLFKERD